MFGLIIFLAVFAYFVYNIIQMTKAGDFSIGEGLKMFFLQGILDLYHKLAKK